VNDPPAPAAKSVNATEDTPLDITGLLVGVVDPDAGDTFTLVNASSPAYGTLAGLDAVTGQVTYTPAPDYNGPDSFEFTVADAAGATGSARVDIAVGERLGAGHVPMRCLLLHSAASTWARHHHRLRPPLPPPPPQPP
jgi:hypothetical protein